MAFGEIGSFLPIISFNTAVNNKLTVIANPYLDAD
jgi:hypothetical protein